MWGLCCSGTSPFESQVEIAFLMAAARLVDTFGAGSMQSSSISRLKGLSMKKFIPLVAFLTSFLFPIVTRAQETPNFDGRQKRSR